MNQAAWDQIEPLYSDHGISPATIEQFRQLKSGQDSHTKQEGNPHHYCSFFLPVHRGTCSIYLCHHRKADDWIPPGGHIDNGETPEQAAIREMQEELDYTITREQLTPFHLSVKPIGRPEKGCMAHYDVWYLVEMEDMLIFQYDPREYFDAGWFPLAEGVKMIQKNPDFAHIVSGLSLA